MEDLDDQVHGKSPAGALADVRVLELGSMLAGPFAGTLFGDFGADVIKVEKPGNPDPLRDWPPHKNGAPLWWKSMARNKRAITLDISRPESHDVFLKLVGMSDIVIENFRPGTLERWGVGPENVRQHCPHAIWLRVSGYGQTGPYRNRGGYATIAEGFSGLASITGSPESGPMVSAFPLGDYLAGTFGAYGAMVALHHRNRTGVGQVIDVSLFEPLYRIIEAVTLRYDQTGEKKARLGNQMEEDVPRNVYASRDGGYIAISCGSQRMFGNLLRAMGREDLKSDARFSTMPLRVENRQEIDAVVSNWMRQRTTADALEVLEHNEVVAGKILDIEEIFHDPHYLARQAWTLVPDEDLGSLRMPSPMPKLSVTPGVVRWAGRKHGQDNELVYGDWLALSEHTLTRLRDAKVI